MSANSIWYNIAVPSNQYKSDVLWIVSDMMAMPATLDPAYASVRKMAESLFLAYSALYDTSDCVSVLITVLRKHNMCCVETVPVVLT